ncbi:MAG: glycosyltransferase family 2 protein [Sulfuricellaceae bacterium]|nr:glycosyltransferase family 2 protein [Sulfuricellaceae bacterium]
MTDRALHLDPRLGGNTSSARDGQTDGMPVEGVPVHLQHDPSLLFMPQPEMAVPQAEFTWSDILSAFQTMVADVIPWLMWAVLFLFVIRYAVLLVSGFLDALRYKPLLKIHPHSPPVSLIVPLTGRTASLRAWLTAALELDYPEYEILLVNDGLADDELMSVKEDYGFERFPEAYRDRLHTKQVSGIHISVRDSRLRWLEKCRGGRADAINAALNCARFPLVCVLDVHLVFKVDFLSQMAERYARTPDAKAVMTPICVTEGVDAGFLAHWQQADIGRTLVFGGINKAGLGLRLAGTPVVGLFDKELLVAAGGFRNDVLNPENHWAVDLQNGLSGKQSTRLAYAPEPLVFSPACKTLGDLGRKHADRQQALMENLNLNRRMAGQSRHGNRLTYLFMLVLEGFWPAIELLGYGAVIVLWLVGLLSTQTTALLLAIGFGMSILPVLAGLLLESHLFYPHVRVQVVSKQFMAAVMEGLGLRLLSVFWFLRGLLRHEAKWGRISKILAVSK